MNFRLHPQARWRRKARSRGNLATAISVIALVVALTGGSALAAGHYLITSTGQIKPSVAKKLRGARGLRGLAGAPGATGPTGATGAPGKNGTDGTNGTNGTNGINGVNGAVAGYYGASTPTVFTNVGGTALVTKALPAGSYVVHGTVSVDSQQGSTQAGAALSCTLTYGGVSQVQAYSAPYNPRDDNLTEGTLSFDLAGASSATGNATITCTDYSGANGAQGGDQGTLTLGGSITAVQTTQNS